MFLVEISDKVEKIFRTGFNKTFLDEEGDLIYFSTDEELRCALQANSNQLRIQTIDKSFPENSGYYGIP